MVCDVVHKKIEQLEQQIKKLQKIDKELEDRMEELIRYIQVNL